MRLADLEFGVVYCGIRNQRYTINKWPVLVLSKELTERRHVPCARQNHRGEWEYMPLTLTQIFPMNEDKAAEIERRFAKRRAMENQSRLCNEAEEHFKRQARKRYGITLTDEHVGSHMNTDSGEVFITVTYDGDEFFRMLDKARQGMMFPRHEEVSL